MSILKCKFLIIFFIYSGLYLLSFQANTVKSCREQDKYGDTDNNRLIYEIRSRVTLENRMSRMLDDYYDIIGLVKPTNYGEKTLFENIDLLRAVMGHYDFVDNSLVAQTTYLLKEIKKINDLINFKDSELEATNFRDQVEIMQAKVGLVLPVKRTLIQQIEQLRNIVESRILLFTHVYSAMEYVVT